MSALTLTFTSDQKVPSWKHQPVMVCKSQSEAGAYNLLDHLRTGLTLHWSHKPELHKAKGDEQDAELDLSMGYSEHQVLNPWE